MKVAFGIAGDFAAVGGDGKATVVGVFTVLNVGQLPATHPRMHLLIGFDQEPDDTGRHRTFRVLWNDPDRRNAVQVGHGSIAVSAPVTEGIARSVIAAPVENLALQTAGPHCFTVELDGQPPYEIPVYVRRVPASGTSPAGPVAPPND